MNRHIVCCAHLPYNEQCPYPALYVVAYVFNEPRLYDGSKEVSSIVGFVCACHFSKVVDEAIEKSPKSFHVKVWSRFNFGVHTPTNPWPKLEG